jgi:hypothetical protein
MVQKNVLLASGSEYSEFTLTVCLGSGTTQLETCNSQEVQTKSLGIPSA